MNDYRLLTRRDGFNEEGQQQYFTELTFNGRKIAPMNSGKFRDCLIEQSLEQLRYLSSHPGIGITIFTISERDSK